MKADEEARREPALDLIQMGASEMFGVPYDQVTEGQYEWYRAWARLDRYGQPTPRST